MADLSGRILGDYLLRAKIGDGGYGDVYRAEHRLLQRVAVVKVLHEKLQGRQDAKVRFVREAQLASQLRHPYAAHVYEVGASHAPSGDCSVPPTTDPGAWMSLLPRPSS